MKAFLLLLVFLSGCAFLAPDAKRLEEPLGPGELRSARAAGDALAIGKSTRSDVRAMLGEAVVVDFASGYEVWVYRERPAEKSGNSDKSGKSEKPSISELVLLFAPSGILAKTRIRQ